MSQSSPAISPGTSGDKATRFRWVICGLLFYATTVNYLDRSIFGVLAGDLQKTIGWHDWQFGLINAAFQLAYGVGFIIMGRVIDMIGTRLGYALALFIWSISGICTAFVHTAVGFGVVRFFLGFGESGNFPAAIKTVAEWFPQRQRATATGIFNAGSNVGAVLAPLLVPLVVLTWGGYQLAHHPEYVAASQSVAATGAATAPSGPKPEFILGWPAAFFITPTLALIWVVLWLRYYQPPAKSKYPNQFELDLIASDLTPTEVAAASAAGASAIQVRAVRWRNLLPHRQSWAFMVGKLLTDPVWWFYLTWGGKFFSDQFHADLKGLAGPMILVYILADFGSIGGGYLSSALLKRGWTANVARKTTMALCALLILPVIFVPIIPQTWIHNGFDWGKWLAATLIGIAAAAHQGFSANIFTVTSDMFPKRAVSSVVGLGGLAGALGGLVFQSCAGVIKEVTNSYLTMFIICGTAYVAAVAFFHLLAPRLEKISDRELESKPMPVIVSGIIGAVLGFLVCVPLSYFAQNHSIEMAQGFGRYFSAIYTGDLFKIDLKLPAEALANARVIRSQLEGPLVWVPLAGALGLAVVFMGIHAFAVRGRPKAAV